MLLKRLLFICLGFVYFSMVIGYTEKVLLVSMDGFRWDYLQKVKDLDNFNQFAKDGIKAKYINNTFITVTFACHYSMATGLYEESHGIVANWMYDPEFDATFGPGNSESRWWNGGEPIWITARKQNKKVATYFWPGSDVEIDGLRPNYWKPYDKKVPFRERVDQIVSWFADDNVDFATLYFHEPDRTGHKKGPESPELLLKLKEMDNILGYLMEKLAERDLKDEVNIILSSDHGMAAISQSRVEYISPTVDPTLIKIVASYGAVCNILPMKGKETQVYNILNEKIQHGKPYLKTDIPNYWHYKNNRRIHAIQLVMDEGWSCYTDTTVIEDDVGNHGYDNRLDSMKPIFLARGPDFKTNYKADPIKSVDIYPLICELLQIKPSPNNGTLANIWPFLLNAQAGAIQGSIFSLSILPFTLFLLSLLL